MADKYKYPFVPKDLYPAVMFACKMIRENGEFYNAVRIASSYYRVDEEDVIKHVRKRQAAGQKGTSRNYKYFYVAWLNDYAYGDEGYLASWDINTCSELKQKCNLSVIRATSEDNCRKQLDKKVWTRGSGFGNSYSGGHFANILAIKELQTKDDECPFTFQYIREKFEKGQRKLRDE